MTEPFDDAIADYVDASMRIRTAVIEQACEAAVQDGRFGVLVEIKMDWGGYRITAKPDPSVPYGQIHERIL